MLASTIMIVMAWRVIAILYLLAQGGGAIAWWLAILLWPDARPHLIPESHTLELFQYLLPADAILFIGGSFLSAVAIWQRRRWAQLCLAIHTGAALYAGFYAWTASINTQSAWLSAILMLVSMVVLPLLVVRVAREAR